MSPGKRSRPEGDGAEEVTEAAHYRPSALDILPVEILAEVLSHVNSPKDVLSVARCNKNLRATLLNPSNVVIWRRAREQCIVPGLPPPLPGWSELAYAAFIFDPGCCDVCGSLTNRMFFSFVVRARICGKDACRNTFLRKSLITLLEGDSVHQREGQGTRGTGIARAVKEYEELTARGLTEDQAIDSICHDSQHRRDISAHADKLYSWSLKWRHSYRITKGNNISFANNLARDAGWDLQDLLNSPSYGSLHRNRNTGLEAISKTVVDLIRPKIDAEILSIAERRERRHKEHCQQIRRAEIAQHYDRMIARDRRRPMPPLAEFRRLPIIKALQDREDATPSQSKTSNPLRILEPELKSSEFIASMIDGDLKKWVDTARKAFDAMLGYPNWKSASTKLVPPAERVTSRFVCTLCRRVPKGDVETGSLDFRGACAHQCPRSSKRAMVVWKADQFTVDQKAVDVLSQALSLAQLKAEDCETEEKIKLAEVTFVCKSCDIPLLMEFRRLAGHSARHESMQVEVVSDAEQSFHYPYTPGLYASLMRHKNEKEAVTKAFGCRHCQHGTSNPPPSERSRNSVSHTQKRFTFNGLISHLKEKHKIFPMGDEDFFRDDHAVTRGMQI
ncbi:hypothetical protein BC834DRAFT_458879 [Gloeopeniophorella convolvens]|nr:hypothetical protein BC834DRAFT_458879 [Gloeopeniophorella convolvens]